MFHLMKYIWSAREELLYPRLPLLGLGVTAVSLSLILDYCSPSDGVQAEETRPPQHIRAQVYGESHPRTQFERGGVSYDIESVCSSVCPSEITANIGFGEKPETFILKDGVRYYSRIDGKDIGDLVK